MQFSPLLLLLPRLRPATSCTPTRSGGVRSTTARARGPAAATPSTRGRRTRSTCGTRTRENGKKEEENIKGNRERDEQGLHFQRMGYEKKVLSKVCSPITNNAYNVCFLAEGERTDEMKQVLFKGYGRGRNEEELTRSILLFPFPFFIFSYQ